MANKKLKLVLPDVSAVVDSLHAKERDSRMKNRLLAVKLAAKGRHTSEEVAEMCGVSRGRLFEWLKQVRTGGLEMLLTRGRPGRKPGATGGPGAQIAGELRAKLDAGEFATAVEAQRWLEEADGQEHSYWKVWSWLKKLGGGAAGAAPQPHQERPRRRR